VLRQDTVAAEFVDSITGVKPYTCDTVYEGLMKSIIQQQVSYRAANVLTSKLVGLAERRMNVDGETQAGFPTPDDLVSIGVDRLRAIGLGYKAGYLYDISRMVLHGDLQTEELLTASYDELVSILSPIRGIGTWTVRTLAIAALRMFDVFPYSDIGIRNLIGRLYNAGIRVTERYVRAKAESWGEAGPMALYLLMCADVLGLAGAGSRKRIKEVNTRITDV
jgi:DNA-3-methyladenine glycosylase II